MNQHYIYLGRGEDGKLWLAGPAVEERPNQNYIVASARWMARALCLPHIEYLGQETDFQIYQAVSVDQLDFQNECLNDDLFPGDATWIKTCRLKSKATSTDQRTIQAIREATNRHTTSPEAAREFLQESGIEGNNGWIDVKDSVPVGFVLIYTGNWIGVGKYDHDAEEDEPVWSDETGEYIDPEPTHWQPLPAPPKTKQ